MEWHRPTDREPTEPTRNFLGFLHFYQPPRNIILPNGSNLDILSWVNDNIYGQCYRTVLEGGIAMNPGVTFSLYPSLRYWLQQSHPNGWMQIMKNIHDLPQKDYQLLGDPFVHAILPHLPQQDQQMLLRIGREAFRRDFHFKPKGIWLPELAVNKNVLQNVKAAGYEFAVLRDTQLEGPQDDIVSIGLGMFSSLPVVQFAHETSQLVSLQHGNKNGDEFLQRYQNWHTLSMGFDGETLGHHEPFADLFFNYVANPNVLAQYERKGLDIKRELKNGRFPQASVKENSSWSCPHRINRWEGKCDCGGASSRVNAEKQALFHDLHSLNRHLNLTLDSVARNWRKVFSSFVIDNRTLILGGGDFIAAAQKRFKDEELRQLMLAKIYTMCIGLTSCGWYFGREDSPERQLPVQGLDTAQRLSADFL